MRLRPPRPREKAMLARLRLATPLARLATTFDPAARPLRRGMRKALLGRTSADERAWMERIEMRRARLAKDAARTGVPRAEPDEEGETVRFSFGDEPVTDVGIASQMMSLSPPWCAILMRLVREAGPRSCLELGTAFGISSAYQAAALRLNGGGSLTTLEGSEKWAERAMEGIAELGLDGVTSRVGPISETLPGEVERCAPLDFVFIDAEHQLDPTLEYFETIAPALSDGALVILDDADWPFGRQAHAVIARHPRISTSVVAGRFSISVAGLDGSRQ